MDGCSVWWLFCPEVGFDSRNSLSLQESSELTKGLHGKLGGLLQKAEDSGRDPRLFALFLFFFPGPVTRLVFGVTWWELG